MIVPGWHMNKRHWNTVTVGSLPDRLVRELVEDSYDLVVAGLPRAERLRLDRA
ncbi:UNVERIFIED_CONTAM: putative DNA-binding protein (MmcQ/YjbR family) [Streptomyces graminofaciens]